MLLSTDGGLSAIRMIGEEFGHEGFVLLVHVVGQSDVIFLVDGLQLGVETADDHILETVGLYLCPILNLIGRNVLCVASHIVRSEGIRTFGSDGCHQFVVFVGDEVFGGKLAHGVNLVVLLSAQGFVGDGAVFLVPLFDVGKERSLCLGVGGSKLACALEHQVLEIVGQTRRFGRVVLRTRAYGNVRLYAGFLLVDGKVNFESVLQRVDACRSGIALD